MSKLVLFLLVSLTLSACKYDKKPATVTSPHKTIEATICLGTAHIVQVNGQFYVQRITEHDDAPLLDINTGCP